MDMDNPEPTGWVVGKTRRQRVVACLAIMSGCMGFIWGMINDMSFGSEGGAPARLHTNGRFEASLVLWVFLGCFGVCLFCAVLYRWFQYLDTRRNEET
jgi:hypothetical protein